MSKTPKTDKFFDVRSTDPKESDGTPAVFRNVTFAAVYQFACELEADARRYQFIRSDDLSIGEHKELLGAIEGNADTYLDAEIDAMIERKDERDATLAARK